VPALALGFIVVVVALTIDMSSSSPPTAGYDVSYPQCSGSYPSNPLFGVVGVNGGLASNANPCIGGELRRARDTPGQKRPKQPHLSLYIDTGNPGGHHVADRPSGNTVDLASDRGDIVGVCLGLVSSSRCLIRV
jgi:hypothetical protein